MAQNDVSLSLQESLSTWRDAYDHEGAHFLLAVSGGRDSMAMLHAVSQAHFFQYAQITACTVDHQLRPDSEREARFVSGYCSNNDIGHCTKKVVVKRRGNLMANARHARYSALRTVADELGATYILTAHHLNDLAENTLMALLKGGHHQKLFDFKARHNGILRPMLNVQQEAIRRYVEEHRLEYCEDPSNTNERYTRNRIRRRVLPELSALAATFPQNLISLQQSHRDDLEHLNTLAGQAFTQLSQDTPKFCLSTEFKVLPPALQWRVLRDWLRPWVKNPAYRSLIALRQQKDGQSLSLGGFNIHQTHQHLWVGGLQRPKAVAFNKDGARWDAWPGKILPTTDDVSPGADHFFYPTEKFCADRLVLDVMRQGERIRIGQSKHKLLSDVFSEAKIPAAARAHWPVLFLQNRSTSTSGNAIAEGSSKDRVVLWVVGLRHAVSTYRWDEEKNVCKFRWHGKRLWTPANFGTN